MDNLWNFFKNLLPKAERSSPSQPLIHEMIERTEEELEDYRQWKQTLVLRRLLDWVKDQFTIYKVAPEDTDEAIDFLDTPSSKGFVIHFNQTRYSRRDATHLFDYLKESVLNQNYRTQISDTRSYSRNKWVETVERHYLKPGLKIQTEPSEAGKFEQKYGNVMIELELRDDKVHNLRFRATSYQDRQFHDASEFGELLQFIMA